MRQADFPLLVQRPENNVLLIVVTGDKGLAGAFNSNLIKGAQRFMAEHSGANTALTLAPVSVAVPLTLALVAAEGLTCTK